MTQTGQNSVVRTRDEQIRYFLDICEDGALTQQAPTTDFIFRMLLEAEARGAEEQRLKDAEGYLFDNPDIGTEFLPYHPVESGECMDAENIREATSAELLSELQGAWGSWKEDRTEKDRIAANVAAFTREGGV